LRNRGGALPEIGAALPPLIRSNSGDRINEKKTNIDNERLNNSFSNDRDDKKSK
jgi:hypothetical protein